MPIKSEKAQNSFMTRVVTLVTAIVTSAMLCFAASATPMPSAPNPPRLVNDFAGIMRQADISALEDSLVHFARHTSTQVTVITVSDLDGYDIAQYAQEISEKWGIGQSDKDNGVVILVKPKTDDSRGRAYIGTGYGAEGALPDVTCTRIVEEKMIPLFKEGDYSGGIIAGAVTVMKAMSGEFEDDEDDEAAVALGFLGLFIIIVLFTLAIICSADDKDGKGGGGRHITRSSGDEWLTASLLNSALTNGGSGGGGWSGGGFGGFGGGHFGGGGGGGSW